MVHAIRTSQVENSRLFRYRLMELEDRYRKQALAMASIRGLNFRRSRRAAKHEAINDAQDGYSESDYA